jgi:hypothetical protein
MVVGYVATLILILILAPMPYDRCESLQSAKVEYWEVPKNDHQIARPEAFEGFV